LRRWQAVSKDPPRHVALRRRRKDAAARPATKAESPAVRGIAYGFIAPAQRQEAQGTALPTQPDGEDGGATGKGHDPRSESSNAIALLGYSPGVVFDANAGYKITGRYQHDGALGRLLGLPEDRVMVVAKGTQADPTVLTAARDLGARVVSNDRFRDWVEAYPEVLDPGHVVRGGYRGGKLWLDLR